MCRPVPAWHPQWELEMLELYSECAVGKALCARELTFKPKYHSK